MGIYRYSLYMVAVKILIMALLLYLYYIQTELLCKSVYVWLYDICIILYKKRNLLIYSAINA